MYARIRRKITDLIGCTSGNAALIVALSAPVLIGGTGLGVDVAQWYMWKRELQFAVDQAAVAGAWAMVDPDTDDSYALRAKREFDANVAVTDDFATDPNVSLANFAGGSNNSVVVTASATKELPFSSFITGESATISAYAQASFSAGTTFTSCIIAIDDDEDGAITIGGNASLTAGCGMAALSDSPEAVTANGNPTVDIGWILARGGIDPWFAENTDDAIIENLSGLFDPFEDLEPPEPTESLTEREYSCVTTAGQTTADVETTTVTTYSYFQSTVSGDTSTPYTYGSPKPDTNIPSTSYGQVVPDDTVEGTVGPTTSTTWTTVSGGTSNGNGNGKGKTSGGSTTPTVYIWERRVTQITTETSNVSYTPGQEAGAVVPGTYDGIQVSCDTTFAPGVYILEGGGLDITAQHSVSGAGVMFVLKDGAYIKIRGGSDDINLTAIQASDLIARGIPAEQANRLAGMLVFEDRDNEGSNGNAENSRNDINGNAATTLNGTMYFPVSNVTFSGTARVTSQCLMIAANTITLEGTTNMASFCPATSSEDTIVASVGARVRLVS